jgi:hypothetical protein
MSKLLKIIIALCISAISSTAKEGMWLPFLLETLNEKDMRAMGMKITASDLYNENKSSLKDAVVLFGGGCTGEVISNQGLLLTNHHCGYGTVSRLATLQNDYLKDGFWAKNKNEEIPCPGLSVTFIVKIVDMTSEITRGLPDDLADTFRVNEVNRRIKNMNKMYTKDGYDASVRPFFADNKYYMFLTEKFNDIRLVGFPPNGIGKFGGDTDNWAWPRHTGDFSLFRIYANEQNKSATYSSSNRPYKPRKFFTINTQGIKPGDFTMVYGFPGRTSQNLTSAGVHEVMNILDPARIKIRTELLQAMEEDMAADRSIYLKYAAKQAGIANYYKKWKGELKGLQINNAVNKKQVYELNYETWAMTQRNIDPRLKTIVSAINGLYHKQKDAILTNEYYREAWGACEGLTQGADLDDLLKIIDKTNSIDSVKAKRAEWEAFYKYYNRGTDYKITKKLMSLMQEQNMPIEYDQWENIYNNSIVTDSAKAMSLFDHTDITSLKNLILNDPGYNYAMKMYSDQNSNFEKYRKNQFELISLYHLYVQGKMKFAGQKPFYPDANSTLRVSYGKVEGLKPTDGLIYDYYTTLDGVMAKEDSTVEEFEVPKKLKELWRNKDYGRYALPNGKMPLAFIASNHTTGGNSGSPVLNAYGELIGTNFDRIYEGTMSDIMYDIELCRNITLDIRYTLFIIDKFGGASWLLDEMKFASPKKLVKARK